VIRNHVDELDRQIVGDDFLEGRVVGLALDRVKDAACGVQQLVDLKVLVRLRIGVDDRPD
jgi:hypothetical protein